MGEKKVKPFGMKDKIGYAFGDAGNDCTFILSSMMLLKFYTDVMGVNAFLVGLMMMIARFIDAITDVAMGQIVDRSEPTEKGKCLPWIRRMMGPVAVASFLMYATWFADMPMRFKIVWMFFTYLLWGSVCYTGVNIPYGSMASVISNDVNDRTKLSMFRTIGAVSAGMFISIILPLVVYYTGEDGNKYMSGPRMTTAALVFSILAVICYICCYSMTTERVKIVQKKEKFDLGKLLKHLIFNKALVGIVVSALLLLTAQLSLSSMGSYIFPNYFRNVGAQSLTGLISVAITLILTTFISKFTKKYGKKEVATVGAVIGAVSLYIGFVINTQNVWLWMVVFAFAHLGMALFNTISWAMIGDVIDDTEVRTGERSDGTIYAVYSFARKLGQACSSGITGIMLGMVGYTAATAFDTNVVNGIYKVTNLVPAIAFTLLTIALLFLYPLDKNTVEKNVQILKEKIEI